MLTVAEILSGLAHYTCSETIYKHSILSWFTYTEGVRFLARNCGAYWLIDAIASHQINPQVRRNPMLQEFQIWRLVVTDESAVLICEADTDVEVLRQEIDFTDFPLPEIKLYVCNKTLMLPREY